MKKRLVALVLLLVLIVATAIAADAAKRPSWTVPGDFPNIQSAINSPLVEPGDTIMVKKGDHSGALVTKQVNIVGIGGARIVTGPLHPAGLTQGFRMLAGSGGSSISGLTFDNIDLAVINGDGVGNVTVSHNAFLSPIQGVSDWRGNGWDITHNTIRDLRTRCGGGIGILVGDFTGGVVSGVTVAHNEISGTLFVSAGDCGGYDGTGIVLYADFRFGRVGATAITLNQVVKNKVELASDTPSVVDVNALELTEADNFGPTPVIYGNAIGFNDFRETETQIVLSPATLDNPVNAISRNFGENRGHGLHPGVFGPGGN